MKRQKVFSIIAWISAAGYLGTAALHSTGYSSISKLSEQTPEFLRLLVPALWLSFSFNLIVIGLIVAVIAFRPCVNSRVILIVASLCPFSTAFLQLLSIGFVPPTAILFSLGALTVISAVILPRLNKASEIPKGSQI